MYILACTDAKFLTEVEIEMTLERQVSTITLEVLTTMILHIVCSSKPLLQISTLLLSSISISTQELHLVYLRICRDENQVITCTIISVDISTINERVRRTALTLVDKTYCSGKQLVGSPVEVIESRSLHCMRHIITTISQLWVV